MLGTKSRDITLTLPRILHVKESSEAMIADEAETRGSNTSAYSTTLALHGEYTSRTPQAILDLKPLL